MFLPQTLACLVVSEPTLKGIRLIVHLSNKAKMFLYTVYV